MKECLASRVEPRPPCFDREKDWEEWLIASNEFTRVTSFALGPPDSEGKRKHVFSILPTKQIDYCSECLPRRRAAMMKVGRCDPTDAPDAVIPSLNDIPA